MPQFSRRDQTGGPNRASVTASITIFPGPVSNAEYAAGTGAGGNRREIRNASNVLHECARSWRHEKAGSQDRERAARPCRLPPCPLGENRETTGTPTRAAITAAFAGLPGSSNLPSRERISIRPDDKESARGSRPDQLSPEIAAAVASTASAYNSPSKEVEPRQICDASLMSHSSRREYCGAHFRG